MGISAYYILYLEAATKFTDISSPLLRFSFQYVIQNPQNK